MIRTEVSRVDTTRVKRGVALATSVLLGLGCLAGETAQSQATSAAPGAQTRAYHINAQALDTALQEFAAQAGMQLLFAKSCKAVSSACALMW